MLMKKIVAQINKAFLFRIKSFFDTLVKSLTKFEFYREILKLKFSFSLRYLFFLFYLVSLVTSIVFAVSILVLILPKLPQVVSTVYNKAATLYPPGLVVSVKNGVLSTNEKEPYYVDSLSQLGLSKGVSHFITIDTNANPSDIKNENTQVLVTRDAFVTLDRNNSYQVYPIDTKTNVTIDANFYKKILTQILPYLRYLEPGLIILLILSLLVWPFVAAAFSLLIELIYLFIFSAVFFLVVKLIKKKLTFAKTYQLVMHGATLPILLGFVVGTFGIHMPFLLPSAILFVFMILVTNQFSS